MTGSPSRGIISFPQNNLIFLLFSRLKFIVIIRQIDVTFNFADGFFLTHDNSNLSSSSFIYLNRVTVKPHNVKVHFR